LRIIRLKDFFSQIFGLFESALDGRLWTVDFLYLQVMTDSQKNFMRQAIQLAKEGMLSGQGGPFGCVIVKDGKIVGQGSNRVLTTQDPTAHAEVVAIREACKNLNHFQLDGCELYASCEPCPMCLGAIYWARPDQVFFACTKEDAAAIGFDDEFIYREIENLPSKRKIPMIPLLREESLEAFELWKEKGDKSLY
jgi:guanine deaminase